MAAIALGIIALASAGVQGSEIARTPPMGWRSWEAFYGHVSQPLIEAVMDAMVNSSRGKSLLELGYSDVGLDDGWQDCHQGVNGSFHDADGNPLVNS